MERNNIHYLRAKIRGKEMLNFATNGGPVVYLLDDSVYLIQVVLPKDLNGMVEKGNRARFILNRNTLMTKGVCNHALQKLPPIDVLDSLHVMKSAQFDHKEPGRKKPSRESKPVRNDIEFVEAMHPDPHRALHSVLSNWDCHPSMTLVS